MILLYKGVSAMSRLIRWMNFSPYSHASYVDVDEYTEFEAAMGQGVQSKAAFANHTPGTVVDLFDVTLSSGEADGLREFFNAELGQPYDYRGLLGFLARRRVENPTAWFCSELVFAGFLTIRKPLLERIEAFKTYPGLLSYSPALKFVKTVTLGENHPCEVQESFVQRARALGCL